VVKGGNNNGRVRYHKSFVCQQSLFLHPTTELLQSISAGGNAESAKLQK